MAGTRRVEFSFDPLPPEVKQMADKAAEEMDQWIDEKVDELAEGMSAQLSAGVKELQDHSDAIEAELKQGREMMEALLADIDTLKNDLEVGDGVEIQEAIEKTQALVETVRHEMTAREEKWKGLGRGVVSRVSNAINGVIPINLP